jgi:PAS domain S-box-containing protein
MGEKAAQAHGFRDEPSFRRLVEDAPEPIAVIREGRFVYANRALVAALGRATAEELYGELLASVLDEGQAALSAMREAEIVRGGGPLPAMTYSVRRPDGSTVLLESVSAYFEHEGKPAILTMARDVTERKELETRLVQADRLAALGTMAAGVAHEINNPLAYVMLNLEWIARKLPAVAQDPSSMDALMEMLQEARQGAERVSNIVRDLRSFSRADGESRRHVDLGMVVQSAVKIAGHEIRRRSRVSTAIEPTRPVWANEGRLEQVVINLLLNAAQAMPESSAAQNEIRVSVRPEGETHAVLEVSDNGQGIPPDVQARIFDPFFTTKPSGVGTGLGLSVSHSIVASLGGTITAYSQPDEGTTFRVVIPTSTGHRSDPPPPSREPSNTPGASSSTPPARSGTQPVELRGRVLVVDDEPSIGATLRELLAPDHDIVALAAGTEALELLRSDDAFDVVFCDLVMPGMSGIELYHALRAERPGLERRIVFMTGGAFTSRTAEFLASVDNRRVEKPFSMGLIEKIVRDMVRRRARSARPPAT